MRTVFFKNPIYVKSGFTIVGPKEADGNFGDCFDVVLKDDLWCEKSYEKCESKMHRDAITGAIFKAGLKKRDIDFMLAGDLINECAPTALAARNFPTAFFGLYNACSTFTEAVLLGSVLIDGGFAKNVTCSTSSHYSSAERQYRFPLELGNQRPPTAQWTVTGAGCTVLSAEKPKLFNYQVYEDDVIAVDKNLNVDEKTLEKYKKSVDKQKKVVNTDKSNIIKRNFSKQNNDYGAKPEYYVKIVGGTVGKVVDLGIDDESNMGAAMAPAAFDTLTTFFRDTNTTPNDYDGVFSGDLGRFGKQTLEYLMDREGLKLPNWYMDCGASYYLPEQKTFQGGSGAGCVNTAFNSYILKKLQKGELSKVIVVATGALLNKDTPLQKETIPGIAHLFSIEIEKP
ncbi:MAG: stage V sporulation protein AD [Clostridia bacterium]|nr:stage V sporulation protein AD [Clostridia bacterium]